MIFAAALNNLAHFAGARVMGITNHGKFVIGNIRALTPTHIILEVSHGNFRAVTRFVTA